MDPGEAVVAQSEEHEYTPDDSKKSALGENYQQINYFNHHDDYSDIYFDKS